LFYAGKFEEWAAAGSKTLGPRAGEQVGRILAQHQPAPLPPDVQKRIDKIVNRAAGQE